jgi:hypothetical protein
MFDSSSAASAWVPIGIAILFFAAFVCFVSFGIFKFVQHRNKRRMINSRVRGHFVFAKIIDGVSPMERGAKYEMPLHQALHAKGFGSVTGGGSQMSRDGNSIEWIGIDIELSNLEEALTFTRQCLSNLGAPQGSVIQYQNGKEKTTVKIV